MIHGPIHDRSISFNVVDRKERARFASVYLNEAEGFVKHFFESKGQTLRIEKVTRSRKEVKW